MSERAEIDPGSGGAAPPTISAEHFMTEFNQNAQIFGQIVLPWVNRIAGMLPEITSQNNQFSYLNGYVGQMREKVLYLEGKLGDGALDDALTADQLTGEDCNAPPPLNLNGGVG